MDGAGGGVDGSRGGGCRPGGWRSWGCACCCCSWSGTRQVMVTSGLGSQGKRKSYLGGGGWCGEGVSSLLGLSTGIKCRGGSRQRLPLHAPVTGGSRPAPRLSKDTNSGVCAGGMLEPQCCCLGFSTDPAACAFSLKKQIFWSPGSGVGFFCTRGPAEPWQEMYRNQEL